MFIWQPLEIVRNVSVYECLKQEHYNDLYVNKVLQSYVGSCLMCDRVLAQWAIHLVQF